MSHLISPSILSANFLRLQEDIEMLNESRADWIHIDVMDGVFVPNITFGFPIIRQINKVAKLPLDVHLMIVEPDRYLDDFKNCGAQILTVHYEACRHLHRTLTAIRKLGMKSGVSLNPHTPVSSLEDILEEIDVVLLMSVNPGFGGQSFINQTLEKVRKLREMATRRGLSIRIEIDGGVNLETGKALLDAGADVLVAGSFVFTAKDPKSIIDQLKNLK
ncbi:MAG: ribulose-phosphate 3-epimerase, partial [Bacteroidota bacterium]|nr:ribulose-phosphate 3-epimerase [Bacteroidota bacterium]